MLLPYSTDAHLYHLPVTTVSMILVNVAMFLWLVVDTETAVGFMLAYGDGLHPTQWLLSNFLHAGPLHLIGNMLGLWVFGAIIEGKIGWWRTAAVILGIGVLQCAIEQTLMLGASEGGSLGASSIVFGLMAIALLWAPANRISGIFLVIVYPISARGVPFRAGLRRGWDENFKALASRHLGKIPRCRSREAAWKTGRQTPKIGHLVPAS